MAIEQDEKKQLIQNKLAFAFDLTFVPTSFEIHFNYFDFDDEKGR